MLGDFPSWSTWLTPIILGGCLTVALTLAAARLVRRLHGRTRLLASAVALAMLALAIAPAVWSAIPVWSGGTTLPVAGPDSQAVPFAKTSVVNSFQIEAANNATYPWLLEPARSRFLVAVVTAQQAAPLMLASNRPVMAFGGFLGTDPILSPRQFSQLALKHVIDRVLVLLPLGSPSQETLLTWIRENCQNGGVINEGELYTCGSG